MNPFRRPLIAGNWKMNAGGQDACVLANGVADKTRRADRVDVILAPPFTALAAVAHEIEELRGSIDIDEGLGIGIAAQNIHHQPSGAFTGEISAPMLRDSGASWVIIGHSERRQLFLETDETVALKTKAALDAQVRPIVCVGETLAEREAGETLSVVERQMRAVMKLLATSPGFGVVAYEPVWAIGTGKVAKPEDAQAVHARIRELLAEESEELAEATRILYGGSVKADNAAGLLGQVDIDGALVGGASLDADGFAKIVQAAQAVADSLAEEEGGPPSRQQTLAAASGEVEGEGEGEGEGEEEGEEDQAPGMLDSDVGADQRDPGVTIATDGPSDTTPPPGPIEPESPATGTGEDDDDAVDGRHE